MHASFACFDRNIATRLGDMVVLYYILFISLLFFNHSIDKLIET